MAQRRLTVEIDADVRRLIEDIVRAAEISGARLQGTLHKALAGSIKTISFETLVKEMERLIGTSRTFNTQITQAFTKFEQFGRQRFPGIKEVVEQTERLRNSLEELAARSVTDAIRKRFASTLDELDESLEQAVADVLKFNTINKDLINTIQQEVLQLRALRSEYVAAMRAVASAAVGTDEYAEALARAQAAQRAYASALIDFQKRHNVTTAAVDRTRLAALSFTQIIQDLPFGLIGVVNNLQQFSLALAVASAESEKASQFFRRFLKSLFDIRQFLIPFSVTVITTLLLAWERFGDQIRETILRLQGVRKEFLDLAKAVKEVQIDVDFDKAIAEFDRLAAVSQRVRQLRAELALAGPFGGIAAQRAAAELAGLPDVTKELNEVSNAIADVIKQNAALFRAFTTTSELIREAAIDQLAEQFVSLDESVVKSATSLRSLIEVLERGTSSEAISQIAKAVGITEEQLNLLLPRLRELGAVLDSVVKAAEDIATERWNLAVDLAGRPEEIREIADAWAEQLAIQKELVLINERLAKASGDERIRLLARQAELQRRQVQILVQDSATVANILEEAGRKVEEYNRRLARLQVEQERASLFGDKLGAAVAEVRAKITELQREQETLTAQSKILSNADQIRLNQIKELIAVYQGYLMVLEEQYQQEERLEALRRRRQVLEAQRELAAGRLDIEQFRKITEEILKIEEEFLRAEGFTQEQISVLLEQMRVDFRRAIGDMADALRESNPVQRLADSVRDLNRQIALAEIGIRGFGRLFEAFEQIAALQQRVLDIQTDPALDAEERLQKFRDFGRELGIQIAEGMTEADIVSAINKKLEEARIATARSVSPLAALDLASSALAQQFPGVISFGTSAQAAATERQIELLKQQAELARELAQAFREAYGEQIPDSIRKSINALEEFAQRAERSAEHIKSVHSGMSGQIVNVLGIISNAYKFASEQILTPVSDIAESLRILGEREIEERKRQLVALGYTESEAAEIAQREGNKKIEAYKKTMKAIIWIQGLGELAGIAQSIAVSVPWPFNIALIALQTAATYARIRARIAQLDRLGSGGGADGAAQIDFGRVVQENPAAVARRGEVLRQTDFAGTNTVVAELREIRNRLDKGLTVDETSSERIVERGLQKVAYSK